MNKKRLPISIILPTLNEIDGMSWFMPRLKEEWYEEIVVCDGGSTDGTIEYCKEHGYPVFIQSGKGLPLGYVEAMKHCTKDIIVFATPDGNSLPELIPELVAKINEGYDMVIGSRYLGSAKSDDDDFFTAIGNRVFTKIINIIFRANYTDTLVGLRAHRRETLLSMKLEHLEQENWLRKNFFQMNSWETGSSIRAAKMKLRVAEIPADEPARIGGVRKLSIIKNGLGVVLQILNEWIIGLKFIDNNSKAKRVS